VEEAGADAAVIVERAVLHLVDGLGGRFGLRDVDLQVKLVRAGRAGEAPAEEVEAAINSATGGLWPDLTLLLDVPPEVGLARQATRNRMENKGLEFHTRVRDGFLVQWQRYPERIHRIDAARPLEQVRAELFHHVEAFLA
jgi:dTMP kinase